MPPSIGSQCLYKDLFKAIGAHKEWSFGPYNLTTTTKI